MYLYSYMKSDIKIKSIMYNFIKPVIAILIFASCSSEKDPQIPSGTEKDKASYYRVDTVKELKTKSTPPDTQKSIDITADRNDSNQMNPEPEEKITSIAELWHTYKSSKRIAEESLEKGDLSNTVKNLAIAGNCALKLGRPEIAAWQFNNIGHYSIEEFKKLTDCDNRLRTLAQMEIDSVKIKLLAETKNIFRKHIDLLLNSQKHLQRAQIIDDELAESWRTEVIESNVEFINWVQEFIK